MNLANNKLVKEVTKHGGELVNLLSKNSPVILTGCAVAGAFVAVGLAIKATKPAMKHIEEAKIDHRDRIIIPDGDEREDSNLTQDEIDAIELKPLEVVQACWKDYIPTALVLVGTTACIIGAHSISSRRTAAMAALYTTAETARKEFEEKANEIVGKGKTEKIKDAVAQDQVTKNPVQSSAVIDTGSGQTLMFDPLTARYFRGDIETIRHLVNDLEARIVGGMECISQNEYYYTIGLDGVATGDECGWSIDNHIELRLTSSLTSNAQPCLVVGFVNNPVPWYQNN